MHTTTTGTQRRPQLTVTVHAAVPTKKPEVAVVAVVVAVNQSCDGVWLACCGSLFAVTRTSGCVRVVLSFSA